MAILTVSVHSVPQFWFEDQTTTTVKGDIDARYGNSGVSQDNTGSQNYGNENTVNAGTGGYVDTNTGTGNIGGSSYGDGIQANTGGGSNYDGGNTDTVIVESYGKVNAGNLGPGGVGDEYGNSPNPNIYQPIQENYNEAQNQGQGTCLHECVPYFQCANGEIIQDGEGIIDLRIYEPGAEGETETLVNVGGTCNSIIDVCCKDPNKNYPVPPTPAPYRPTQCGAQYDDQTSNVDVRIHLNQEKHGFDNVAQFGAYPWMAAILKFNSYENKDLNIYQCGGSLINQQVILTAAHCVEE